MEKSTISRQLARYVNNLSYDKLPAEVIEKTKTLFLHGIGVGLAAYDTETAQIALGMAKKEKGDDATILVDGSRVPATAAVFANSTILHSRIQEDDFHAGMSHLGVVTIPAALAASEMAKCSGKDIIVALAAGYEVGARLSKDFGVIMMKRGFRPTPVYGPFPAATAAAKLLKLNEEQLVYSLGWAANLASGFPQYAIAKTPEIPIQAGLAARNGMMAVQLAQAGARVAEDMLEGERGFYNAFCGTRENLDKIVAGIGKNYEMLEIFLKPFPIGGLAVTATSAMLTLVQEHNFTPDDVAKVEVVMSPKEALAPGASSPKPGMISVAYCLAIACVYHKVSLAAMADIGNKKVLEFMPRVTVIPDDSVEPLSCKLTVTLKDGKVLRKDIIATEKDYCYNFSEDRKLVEGLIPEMAIPTGQAQKVIELIANMENWESTDELIKTLSSPGRKVEQPIKLIV